MFPLKVLLNLKTKLYKKLSPYYYSGMAITLTAFICLGLLMIFLGQYWGGFVIYKPVLEYYYILFLLISYVGFNIFDEYTVDIEIVLYGATCVLIMFHYHG